MELLDNIRKISFVFFIVIGLVHFLAGLFATNGYYPETSSLLNRVLFIPFVIATLMYVFSGTKYKLLEYGKDKSWHTYTFLAVGLIVFLTLLALELLLPDSPHPLIPSP